MTTKEKIEIMQAFENGEEVEIYNPLTQNWQKITSENPEWSWGFHKFRIKPKEINKYEVYKNTKELIDDFIKRYNLNHSEFTIPVIWVRCKINSKIYTIGGFTEDSVDINREEESLENLFKFYEYLDGSICGKKVIK